MISDKSAIVMLWRGIVGTVVIASSTFDNRVIFRQQNLLIFHYINNCSRSGHAYLTH